MDSPQLGAHSQGASVSSTPNFAHSTLCAELIAVCERHGFTCERTESQYAQATTDLEVDSAPAVRHFVLSRGLIPAVRTAMLASHGVTPVAFDDMFVVRYDAEEQRELVRHFDAGDVSFMLALSAQTDYAGGGTAFDAMGSEVVHLEQGELVLFDAALYHAGLPITRGKRYLLVGFCYTLETYSFY